MLILKTTSPDGTRCRPMWTYTTSSRRIQRTTWRLNCRKRNDKTLISSHPGIYVEKWQSDSITSLINPRWTRNAWKVQKVPTKRRSHQHQGAPLPSELVSVARITMPDSNYDVKWRFRKSRPLCTFFNFLFFIEWQTMRTCLSQKSVKLCEHRIQIK